MFTRDGEKILVSVFPNVLHLSVPLPPNYFTLITHCLILLFGLCCRLMNRQWAQQTPAVPFSCELICVFPLANLPTENPKRGPKRQSSVVESACSGWFCLGVCSGLKLLAGSEGTDVGCLPPNRVEPHY